MKETENVYIYIFALFYISNKINFKTNNNFQ